MVHPCRLHTCNPNSRVIGRFTVCNWTISRRNENRNERQETRTRGNCYWNILFDIGFLFASFSLRSTSRLIIASHRKTTVHLENNMRKPQSIRLAANNYTVIIGHRVNTYLRQLIPHFRSPKVKTRKETPIFRTHFPFLFSHRITTSIISASDIKISLDSFFTIFR